MISHFALSALAGMTIRLFNISSTVSVANCFTRTARENSACTCIDWVGECFIPREKCYYP